MEEITRSVPEHVLDGIYKSLLDAYERLPTGTAHIKSCLNYLEAQHGYQPPSGYHTRPKLKLGKPMGEKESDITAGLNDE